MKKFILTHTHKYGVTTYVFESNSTISGLESNLNSVCDILHIDFDDTVETITISELPDQLFTVIL